jgi:hypothetical protein
VINVKVVKPFDFYPGIYSMWIASEGQTSTQVWQSTHMSLSTFAFSLSIDIADAGHSFTQVSQPVHFSLSTTATKNVHSTIMASDGQTSTQVWQSTHMSLSTFAFSSSIDIADAGHSFTHVSQPVHFSLSMTATKMVTPAYMFHKIQKKGFDMCMTVMSF